MIFPSHPHCTLCPLHAAVVRNVGIPTLHIGLSPTSSLLIDVSGGDGVTERAEAMKAAKIPACIWIGMNPGYYEDINNEPFFPQVMRDRVTGDPRPNAGLVFRDVYLDSIDMLTRAANYVTNIVRCGPDPDPPAKSATACFAYTVNDIETIFAAHSKSKIAVILLGGYAVAQFNKLFLGKRITLDEAFNRNGNSHTYTFTTDTSPGVITVEYTLFATWHPAYLTRQEAMKYSVGDHLALLDDFLEGMMVCPSQPNMIPPRNPLTS